MRRAVLVGLVVVALGACDKILGIDPKPAPSDDADIRQTDALHGAHDANHPDAGGNNPACQTPAQAADNFDGTALSADWEIIGSAGDVTVEDNAVTLTVAGGTPIEIQRIDCVGALGGAVDVVLASDSTAVAAFTLFVDNQHFASIVHRGGKLNVTYDDGFSGGAIESAQVQGPSGVPYELRFQESGGTVGYVVTTDPPDYVGILSAPTPSFFGNAFIQLSAAPGSLSGTATFEALDADQMP